MTYLEVFAVNPGGNVKKYGEAKNAWGGAMHIWRTLDARYQTGSGVFDYTPLWSHIGSMSEPDQWVLASTYDWVLVKKEHLPTFIKHLSAFAERYPTSTLDELLPILDKASCDKDVRAIGFNQTSVCDMWWHRVDAKRGKYYNIHREKKHWYLTPEYLESKRKKA